MAANKKQPSKSSNTAKAAQKKAAPKKATQKKPVAKAGQPAQAKKKPGRPPKASQPKDSAVVKTVTGVAVVADKVHDASILITANDVKSTPLRKRMLKWFKRS